MAGIRVNAFVGFYTKARIGITTVEGTRIGASTSLWDGSTTSRVGIISNCNFTRSDRVGRTVFDSKLASLDSVASSNGGTSSLDTSERSTITWGFLANSSGLVTKSNVTSIVDTDRALRGWRGRNTSFPRSRDTDPFRTDLSALIFDVKRTLFWITEDTISSSRITGCGLEARICRNSAVFESLGWAHTARTGCNFTSIIHILSAFNWIVDTTNCRIANTRGTGVRSIADQRDIFPSIIANSSYTSVARERSRINYRRSHTVI